MNYVIVTNLWLEDLMRDVNDKLGEGYRLAGGLAVETGTAFRHELNDCEDVTIYHQAMILQEE